MDTTYGASGVRLSWKGEGRMNGVNQFGQQRHCTSAGETVDNMSQAVCLLTRYYLEGESVFKDAIQAAKTLQYDVTKDLGNLRDNKLGSLFRLEGLQYYHDTKKFRNVPVEISEQDTDHLYRLTCSVCAVLKSLGVEKAVGNSSFLCKTSLTKVHVLQEKEFRTAHKLSVFHEYFLGLHEKDLYYDVQYVCLYNPRYDLLWYINVFEVEDQVWQKGGIAC